MDDLRHIDRVIPGLYISGARAVYQAPALRKAGITRVLKLYEGPPDWPPDFHVCDNPLEDGAPIPSYILSAGVAFIHQSMAAGEKVLVTCGAGISRSSTFVLAYLVESGYDLRDAWQLLRQRHPPAYPAFALWESLLAYYNLPYTLRDILEWMKRDDEENG